jgi:ubiquinone/menaquinone biosynthesis C-methylase UbiE
MTGAATAVAGNPLWEFALRRFLLPPLFDAIGPRSPSRILEVGCATGLTTRILLERFPGATIIAIDVDADAIASAKRRVTDSRVTFAVADATRLPYQNGAFDLVIELNSFHHVAQWRDAVAECARVTAPGGSFAAMDENVGAWGWLFRLFDRPASTFSSREFVAVGHTLGLHLKGRFGGERFMRFVFVKPPLSQSAPT